MRRTIIGAAAAVAGLGATGVAIGQIAAGVGSAQQRAGSPPDVLAPGFSRSAVALGSQSLENPASFITRYGYLSDSASQSSGLDTKTEPDQNTYLVSKTNPGGPAAGFDYGRHFLVQGHELFSSSSAGVGHSNSAYFTRVNLDVALNDPHRITLLSKPDANGNTGSASIDGSNYDPFTGDLVFTGEGNNRFGGVFMGDTGPEGPAGQDGKNGRDAKIGRWTGSTGSCAPCGGAAGTPCPGAAASSSRARPRPPPRSWPSCRSSSTRAHPSRASGR